MRTWKDKLYLGAMPGRHESIEKWQDELQQHRIDRVVCLAPADEIKKKSPAYWLWRQKNADIEVTDVPVPDYGIPMGDDAAHFREEARRVAQEMRYGSRIFIHCGAGVGRTGTFAAAVLLAMGYDLSAAIREIEPLGSWPETSRQREFLSAGV